MTEKSMSDSAEPKKFIDSAHEPKHTPLSPGTLRIPRLRDLAILAGWIGGLLLIGGLCWFLSAPLRTQRLMKSVNQVLALAGDPRRLDAVIPHSELSSEALRIGTWYTMAFSHEGSRAVVFTLIAEGRFFPCAAEINPAGRVEEIIPLSGERGEGKRQALSPGSLQIYIRRIEGIAIEGIKGGTQ
jgi:hypothetical protein